MMHHRIRKTVFVLLKSQKGLIISLERRLVVSDHVGGGTVFSSAAMGGGVRRFFNTGGRRSTAESSSPSVIRNMFRAAGDIPNMFRGRQTGGCVGSFVPHQCNKIHMLPYFVRALTSSSASQSSGQTPQQEPTKKKKRECHIINSKLQTERYDEISSTNVSLNQFPRLMAHGMVENSKTRPLLRMNPETRFFEEQVQDVATAAANDDGHYDLLQVPHEHICRGSAYGWLFLTDDNLDMKLFNPFSGAEIQLPPVKTLPLEKDEKEQLVLSKWFVWKAVFSANPSIEPRPVVLVIYRGDPTPRLAFCKPGDKGWTPLEFPKISFLMDAIYHEGQFYVLGWPGYVAAFDIGRRIDDDDHSVKMDLVVANAPKRRLYMRDCYLVMLDGELVRFDLKSVCLCNSCIKNSKEKLWGKRDGDTTDDEDCCFVDYSYEGFLYEAYDEKKDDEVHLDYVYNRRPMFTYEIKIHRFDTSEKQWVKLESLGGKAVFLGYNTGFALSVSDYPDVCFPDAVYFTYGLGGNSYTERRFYDTGIYDLEDKAVEVLVHTVIPIDPKSFFVKPAPIWIVNSADR